MAEIKHLKLDKIFNSVTLYFAATLHNAKMVSDNLCAQYNYSFLYLLSSIYVCTLVNICHYIKHGALLVKLQGT